jgi:hypothetical protein
LVKKIHGSSVKKIHNNQLVKKINISLGKKINSKQLVKKINISSGKKINNNQLIKINSSVKNINSSQLVKINSSVKKRNNNQLVKKVHSSSEDKYSNLALRQRLPSAPCPTRFPTKTLDTLLYSAISCVFLSPSSSLCFVKITSEQAFSETLSGIRAVGAMFNVSVDRYLYFCTLSGALPTDCQKG